MMKTKILTLIFTLSFCGCLFAAPPDDTCSNGWKQGGNGTGSEWTLEQQQTFSSVASAATVERSLGLCGAGKIVLRQVIVSSTDCTDCDVFISTVSGAGGTKLLYQKDDMDGDTVNGVVYTLYSNALVDSRATTGPTIVGNDTRVYVRVKNNDGGARSVIVTTVWGL